MNDRNLISKDSNAIRAISRLRVRIYRALDMKRIREEEIKKLEREEEIIHNELIKSGNKGKMFEKLTDIVDSINSII